MHVYVYAPLAERIRAVAERERVSRQVAAKLVAQSDRNRAGYLRSYYGVDWQDPALYDLIINTGRISLAEAAELVARAVAMRGPLPGERAPRYPQSTEDGSSR